MKKKISNTKSSNSHLHSLMIANVCECFLLYARDCEQMLRNLHSFVKILLQLPSPRPMNRCGITLIVPRGEGFGVGGGISSRRKGRERKAIIHTKTSFTVFVQVALPLTSTWGQNGLCDFSQYLYWKQHRMQVFLSQPINCVSCVSGGSQLNNEELGMQNQT